MYHESAIQYINNFLTDNPCNFHPRFIEMHACKCNITFVQYNKVIRLYRNCFVIFKLTCLISLNNASLLCKFNACWPRAIYTHNFNPYSTKRRFIRQFCFPALIDSACLGSSGVGSGGQAAPSDGVCFPGWAISFPVEPFLSRSMAPRNLLNDGNIWYKLDIVIGVDKFVTFPGRFGRFLGQPATFWPIYHIFPDRVVILIL